MLSRHDFSITRRSFLRGILAAETGLTAGTRFAWSAAVPERLVVAEKIPLVDARFQS